MLSAPKLAHVPGASTASGAAAFGTNLRPVEACSETHNAGDRLVAWATSHGAMVSPKVAFLQPGIAGDRHCIARHDLEEGELLVELPRALAFETPPAQPRGVPLQLVELLRACAERSTMDDEVSGKSLCVALLLHYERLKGTASAFSPYLETLPTSFRTLPLFDNEAPWNPLGSRSTALTAQDQDVAHLYKGTGVQFLAQAGVALAGPEGVAKMKDVIEALDPEHLHWQHADRTNRAALAWAAAAVQSRAHASKLGATVLVPLADAFNHSPCSANVDLCEGEVAFQVRALRTIAAGEELFLFYGCFSSAELLFNAGFTCPENPHDCVLVSRLDLRQAAERRWQARGDVAPNDLAIRCKTLAEGLPAPKLRAAAPLLGGAVPVAVVTFLAGLLLEAEDWLCHFKAGGIGGLSASWQAGHSSAEHVRSEVLHALQDLVEFILKPRYHSMLHDDASALSFAEGQGVLPLAIKEVARQRQVNILRVRVGERKVLAHLGGALTLRLGALVPATTADPDSLSRKRARLEGGT